ncbi:altered inheritance of mitochondria protein 24, mitochondrial protein Fmp26 [Histoplasma capsulatum var. duboisii H88]|uniref:Altered inheritance of mitochondria protein 24, mitochondrial n=1 Tax=Ajellomyces capsulatus (strain H88) TaxID=544711 RepID=A0A8A1LAL1_AJEC8|nr:altered inheritance of mitochondria protein 24, mitochondrial protein Fmp26 [Histoplasma capsulatum var. duboisii H88]
MSYSIRNSFRPLIRSKGVWRKPAHRVDQSWIHIQQLQSAEPGLVNGSYLPASTTANSASSPDAKFQVLGAPYSLLSVTLSASQNLYTRRGTLVGLSGKADNVVSTLRLLEPGRRALLRIPFLYQKISSTSPITALISTRSACTTFSVVELNGSVDWMITQEKALLAWTGHTLRIIPKLAKQLSLSHWGNSEVTGRGLLALVGTGQFYSVELKAGEQYICHPSNVVAYTTTAASPRPYRFKSTILPFQIPSIGLGQRLSDSNFIKNMSDTDTWKASLKLWHTIRTWTWRTILGERLFLQFDGPATILVQSRASRIADALTTRQVNEIADAPPGVTQEAVRKAAAKSGEAEATPKAKDDLISKTAVSGQSFASVMRDGKVEFHQTGDSQRK